MNRFFALLLSMIFFALAASADPAPTPLESSSGAELLQQPSGASDRDSPELSSAMDAEVAARAESTSHEPAKIVDDPGLGQKAELSARALKVIGRVGTKLLRHFVEDLLDHR